MNGCQWKMHWTKQPKRKWLPFFMRALNNHDHRSALQIHLTYLWNFREKPIFLIIHRSVCPACQYLKGIFNQSKELPKYAQDFVMVNMQVCAMCIIVMLFVIYSKEKYNVTKCLFFVLTFVFLMEDLSTKIYVASLYEQEIMRKKFYQDTKILSCYRYNTWKVRNCCKYL